MIYLLLSLIILIVQGILDMADWWVLGSNFMLSGLLCIGAAGAIVNQRLVNFNSYKVIFQCWAVLSVILNLTAIHVTPTITQGQQALLLIGFDTLLILSVNFWQQEEMPIRSILIGLVLGLMSSYYTPILLWLPLPLLLFFNMSCLSIRNVCSAITGFVTAIWLWYFFYAMTAQPSDPSYVSLVLQGFDLFCYDLPQISSTGYTGWILLAAVPVTSVSYITGSYLNGQHDSLRMRSVISNINLVSLYSLLLLPSNWTLYLILTAFNMVIHAFITLGNDANRPTQRNIAFWTIFFLLIGIAEPLIRMVIDYCSTIHIELPFDLPW